MLTVARETEFELRTQRIDAARQVAVEANEIAGDLEEERFK